MVACACDKIVAHPATVTGSIAPAHGRTRTMITHAHAHIRVGTLRTGHAMLLRSWRAGSIGVLSGVLDASGFLRQQRIGVTRLHEGAPPLSASAPLSRAQRRELRAMAAETNASFESKVASGRGLSLKAVRRVGQGRVWTGQQAVERGLVDAIGGVGEACALACQAAGVEGWASGEVATREIGEQAASGGIGGMLTSSGILRPGESLTSLLAASAPAAMLSAMAWLDTWQLMTAATPSSTAVLSHMPAGQSTTACRLPHTLVQSSGGGEAASYGDDGSAAALTATATLPCLLPILLGSPSLGSIVELATSQVVPQPLSSGGAACRGVLLAQLSEMHVRG